MSLFNLIAVINNTGQRTYHLGMKFSLAHSMSEVFITNLTKLDRYFTNTIFLYLVYEKLSLITPSLIH